MQASGLDASTGEHVVLDEAVALVTVAIPDGIVLFAPTPYGCLIADSCSSCFNFSSRSRFIAGEHLKLTVRGKFGQTPFSFHGADAVYHWQLINNEVCAIMI